jgi:putative addiction module killer protein
MSSNLWHDVIRINKTPEFEEWFSSLRIQEQAQIEARFYRIELFDHFGDCKLLKGTDNTLSELRWKNGFRVYFYREGRCTIRLLLGGIKNGQKTDIKKARLLLKKYAYFKE